MATANTNPLIRQTLQEKIDFALSVLQVCVKNRGLERLFSINTVAETFVKDILNTLLDLNLQNLNNGPNFPAIDLGDAAKRVCFQVTSDGKVAKVKKTIKMFAKHDLASDYDTLRIFVIGTKKNYDGMIVPPSVRFDVVDGVLDIPDILRQLPSLQIARLEELSKLIDREMPLFKTALAADHQTDDEALEVYRSQFARRALYDEWSVEGDVGNFRDAVDELLGLMTMGVAKGVRVTKQHSKFADQHLREGLERVFQKLVNLRQLYTHHERVGDINPKTNFGNFGNRDVCFAFNSYKQDVLDEMSGVLRSRGLRQLEGVSRMGRPWRTGSDDE